MDARVARQLTQSEQQALPSFDFGACWPQSFAAASFFILAQQPFLICSAATRVGMAASPSEPTIAKHIRSLNAVRTGRII